MWRGTILDISYVTYYLLLMLSIAKTLLYDIGSRFETRVDSVSPVSRVSQASWSAVYNAVILLGETLLSSFELVKTTFVVVVD